MHDFKILYSKQRFILSLLVLVISVTSCRTIHQLPIVEIEPMPVYKIIRKIERESPVYNNYESKKISIDYVVNNEKNSFSGQFKNKRNKSIILNIRKLSIPLGKGLITPDSLVFVNYFDKSFLSGDFGDIKELLGIDLDYNLIQALFTADISKVLNEENFDKEISSVIDSQMYRIDSRLDSIIYKNSSSGKEKKQNRFLKKGNDSEFTDYSLWIDPQHFVVRKIIINDIKYNKKITICYDQYEMVGRSMFPQQISFESFSTTQKLSILLKLSKSSVNTNNDFSFSIPDKFEKSK